MVIGITPWPFLFGGLDFPGQMEQPPVYNEPAQQGSGSESQRIPSGKQLESGEQTFVFKLENHLQMDVNEGFFDVMLGFHTVLLKYRIM